MIGLQSIRDAMADHAAFLRAGMKRQYGDDYRPPGAAGDGGDDMNVDCPQTNTYNITYPTAVLPAGKSHRWLGPLWGTILGVGLTLAAVWFITRPAPNAPTEPAPCPAPPAPDPVPVPPTATKTPVLPRYEIELWRPDPRQYP